MNRLLGSRQAYMLIGQPFAVPDTVRVFGWMRSRWLGDVTAAVIDGSRDRGF